jgi:hypothetical protein
MIEVINKNHEAITTRRKTKIKSFIKFHNDKEIIFSQTAIRELGLAAGMYVHFVNEDSDWLFYVNDDPDGFEIKKARGNSSGRLSIYNMSLIILFCNRTRSELPCAYPLRETRKKHEGKFKLVQIETGRLLKPHDYGYKPKGDKK